MRLEGLEKERLLLDLNWEVQISYLRLREHHAILNGVTLMDPRSMEYETV